MRYASPLRYPGGKASLFPFIRKVIELNDMTGCSYFEPYAGGAGAALELLHADVVSHIVINDADIRIYALWKSILDETDRFVEQIFSVPLTIEEWRKQRRICDEPNHRSLFEIGFSAFYMNRCNRSGILLKAGPIGGMEQKGTWKMDARFNRENLARRIIDLKKMRERIDIHSLDAIDFLKTTLPKGRGRKNAFVYLDPPYVEKADKLYMNNYSKRDHKVIAAYLKKQKSLRWILSYDNADIIRNLYDDYRIFRLPIRYSLQSKKMSDELMIVAEEMFVPKDLEPIERIHHE